MHHDHHQERDRRRWRIFFAGVLLNVLFVVVEVIYGLAADSLALIADAGHNLSDVLSLLLAWGAAMMAGKAASDKRTYGYGKMTVLAPLASAIMLLFAMGGIAWEAISRIGDPPSVAGRTVLVVAGIGVVINSITALLFASGRRSDVNIRAAFVHMAADAGVSLGVVAGAVLILLTGWARVDAIVSLLVVGVILVGTWSLLRDSMNLALDAVPETIDIEGIRTYLTGLPPVSRIHDLHVWPLSSTRVALTVHLVVREAGDDDASGDRDRIRLAELQVHLRDRFDIDHSTIQVERENERTCPLNGCT